MDDWNQRIQSGRCSVREKESAVPVVESSHLGFAVRDLRRWRPSVGLQCAVKRRLTAHVVKCRQRDAPENR